MNAGDTFFTRRLSPINSSKNFAHMGRFIFKHRFPWARSRKTGQLV